MTLGTIVYVQKRRRLIARAREGRAPLEVNSLFVLRCLLAKDCERKEGKSRHLIDGPPEPVGRDSVTSGKGKGEHRVFLLPSRWIFG